MAEESKILTVGELRSLLDEVDLEDDALVIVMAHEGERMHDEDDGERLAARVSAAKGVGERSYVRIWLDQ